MIRLLKEFADWLDRRYPPKVHVTDEVFDDLRKNEYLLRKNVSSLKLEFDTMQAEFAAIRKSVDGMKDALSKGGVTAVKTEAETLRTQFVEGNFVRGPR